jgi:hypothetical protein
LQDLRPNLSFSPRRFFSWKTNLKNYSLESYSAGATLL